jgi:hypothetical protein
MTRNLIKTIIADIHHIYEQYNFKFEPHPLMPLTEREYLETLYRNASSILEFGTGGSTLFAIESSKKIVAIESDKKFYNYLTQYVDNTYPACDAKITLAKTGVTGRYGMPLFHPLTLDVSAKGMSYVLSGYSQYITSIPDLIFVDGRWRTACCLYALLRGWRDSTAIFLDDYDDDRSYRKIIEKYFTPELHGRIARLIPKQNLEILTLVDDFIASLDNPE